MSEQDNSSNLVSIPDDHMVAVPKEFFIDGVQLPATLYLKIKSNHYIVIGKKGAISAISTYHSTAKADVKIYIKAIEYSEVINNNLNFTGKVLNNSGVTTSTKMRYLNALSESVLNDVFAFGVGVANIENVKTMSSYIQEVSSSIAEIDEILASFESLPNDIARHSLTTAFISMLLAQEMNITLAGALDKLVLGALLHDIGLREIPRDILTKPRRFWTEDEIQYYESHPMRGVEILRDIPQISNEVLTIVNEHHENAVGLGFPRRIRDVKMFHLSKIVALADYVADMMYGTVNDVRLRSIDEIIQHIENTLGQPYNKAVFLALKNIGNKQNLLSKQNEAKKRA